MDEGYVNTGSTTSSITFLDGEEGVLRYRGYPIEQIAVHCDFVETSYLLIYGKLPTEAELITFRESIRRHTMIHEDMRSFYNGFPKDAHPMAILSSVVGALSTFYQDSLDPHDARQVEVSIHRLMAKLPTIAAYSYKKSIGQPFMYPHNDLSYCENFLRMMFAVPTMDYEPDPVFVEALNLLLICHADHEQNCSTSTVRMVGSSNANLFASISAGICALWGPLHGGANEACINMLQQIVADGGNVKKYCSCKIHCSKSHRNWKRWLWKIPTSSSGSFIPTWTSTRALFTERWACRLRCSRCCSPSGDSPDGLLTGSRCTNPPLRASVDRGKCTLDRRFGTWFR
jgi:citrate synthase